MFSVIAEPFTQSYLDQVVAYAERVTSGAEVAGRFERLACQRFLRDLQRAGTDDFPYVLNRNLGARACRFIELLPHIKGEWARPVYVDGQFSYQKIKLGDWQLFCEFQLFGWVHRDTGLRRFRRSYEEVARKNAKSTRAAARELYLLTADGEPGAHCYSAATTGEQAREVFDVARNMALREPEFLARFGVAVGKHDITLPGTASSMKPLNAEGSTLDGLNIHGCVVDELHAHKTRAVWDVLDSATGARSQPLISAITTAGSDRSGICYELRDYTIKVLAPECVPKRNNEAHYNARLPGTPYYGCCFALWHECRGAAIRRCAIRVLDYYRSRGSCDHRHLHRL
jgi:phage terminase large subunit-like protein